ncbi:hypothetical protein [Serratia quinivorans]|uniref:hypothetical protein n=1 Tax=Serratia quinivorans TaxID=137545 RepID=UPI003F945DEB
MNFGMDRAKTAFFWLGIVILVAANIFLLLHYFPTLKNNVEQGYYDAVSFTASVMGLTPAGSFLDLINYQIQPWTAVVYILPISAFSWVVLFLPVYLFVFWRLPFVGLSKLTRRDSKTDVAVLNEGIADSGWIAQGELAVEAYMGCETIGELVKEYASKTEGKSLIIHFPDYQTRALR